MLARAEETELNLKKISGLNTVGYYYVLIDKDPGDEYKYLVQGEMRVGDLYFPFLTNNIDSRKVPKVIDMLEQTRDL